MQVDIRNKIRTFMLFEAATFVVASLIHAGVLVVGYEHHEAHLAEAVIALVLIVALAFTWIRPAWTRAAGLAGQGFALFGTLVGLSTIAIGVGPRTVPDIAYHLGIVAVLVWGLGVAKRAQE
jgi:phosphoglycerol transferase MdoB-like AlkP superfamily enzyme